MSGEYERVWEWTLLSSAMTASAPAPVVTDRPPLVGVDLRPVLQRLAARACELLGGDKSVIVMRDRCNPRLTRRVAAHNTGHEFLAIAQAADDGISGRVLRSGRAVIVRDYQAMRRPVRHPATRDLCATVAVPVRWGGEVQAALWVATTTRDREFGPADAHRLSQLADFAALALENCEMRERLEHSVAAGVRALAHAVELRDGYTAEHSEQVAALAGRVAEHMGLSGEVLSQLAFAARLHDIGKIGVPDRVLQKRGRLTHSEWELMREHAVWGARMLQRIPGLETVARIVRAEHEHWDGTGYPDGLSGTDIPIASRIILACDAYHAMTSDRPYRRAISRTAAARTLQANAATQFDPTVIDALLCVLAEDTDELRAPHTAAI